MALLELVEGLVSQNGQSLFRIRYGEDDDRALSFARRGAISALNVYTGLGQKVCHFVQGPRLVFQAENEGGLFSKFDLCGFQCRAGTFEIRNEKPEFAGPCYFRSRKCLDVDTGAS